MRWKMFVCRFRLKWRLFKIKKSRPPSAYADARQIAMVSSVECTEEITPFIESLRQENKHVHVLLYSPNDTVVREDFISFNETSLSFWGLLRSETINNFVQQEYDILIHASLKPSVLIDQLCCRINAKLKSSICTNVIANRYDLLIREDKLSKSLEVLKRYIKTFAELV